MRNADPIFWPSADIDQTLSQARQKNYTDCINILQTQWYQADVDQRFVLGDQDLWGLIFPGVATYRRKIFNFNIINPMIQAISGQQRQNRKSTISIPIQSPMQKTSDQLTKCLYYIHNKSGAYQVYSDAFESGALVQGLGFISIFMDHRDDPSSGDPALRYVDMKSCLFDPYFRKHDMSDARFWWTRQFFDRQDAALIHPEYADQIQSLPKGSYRDDKFYYMPEVYQIQFPNLIALDEYWYLSSREAEYIVDTETNEVQEYPGDEEDMRILFMKYGKRFKLIKKRKSTVRRSIILNDKVLVDEDNPYGLDRYPIVPVLGYFTPDTPYYAYKFRGITRDLRDAQYLYNRLKVSNLDILESQQQGLKIKKGALVTPDDSLNVGHGRVLAIDPSFNMDDVQNMDIHPPSPVMLQMEDMLMNVAHRISGLDPAAMGIDVDDKAGIIAMMRHAASARNLQRLFDQFDEAQRLCGDILVEMVQKNWTYNKVKMVIGEEPTDEFDNKAFYKYGCKVVQGVLTEQQAQLELAQLLDLQQRVNEAHVSGGIFPVEEIIEAMTIQNKDRIVEKIQKAQQAQQEMQQKRNELELQQLQVDNETKLSYARSQEGLAAERIAKIETDKAVAQDKLKRAYQEDTHALLNLVKVAKELKNLDIDKLSKEIEMLKLIAPEPQKTTAEGG